jgi:hypothetical protein
MEDLKKIVHQQEEKAERSKKSSDELETLSFVISPPIPVTGDIKMDVTEVGLPSNLLRAEKNLKRARNKSLSSGASILPL